jgi:hypothetical protein
VAVATDEVIDCRLPVLDINDPDAVVTFILDYLDTPC